MENEKGFEFEGNHYTMYEGTQLQRQIETKIRQYKDRQIGAKSIDDTDEVYHCQEKIRQLTDKYYDLHKVSGLPTKIDRLRVDGYRSISSKKVINTDENNNYIDITSEWLETATPNSHTVEDRQYFEYKGNRYNVDGKNVVLDYSLKEKEIAEWLENTFGGEIYMLPRINNPEGIQTADYLFRGEYWDLKEIIGKGKHTLDSAIKKKKSQSNNFIFDMSNSEITVESISKQLNLIYKSKDRKWVDKIIVKQNKNVIIINKRKQKRD